MEVPDQLRRPDALELKVKFVTFGCSGEEAQRLAAAPPATAPTKKVFTLKSLLGMVTVAGAAGYAGWRSNLFDGPKVVHRGGITMHRSVHKKGLSTKEAIGTAAGIGVGSWLIFSK